MRVLVSGSTGLIGEAITRSLRGPSSQVVRLVRPSTHNRSAARAGSQDNPCIDWDPVAGTLDPAATGADAVIHLAGASIADGRWTASRKRLLRESRIVATRKLVDALGQLPKPPRILIAASAIGVYGDRGDEELTESSPPGHDFLADLCCDWEAETSRAAAFGARVVSLRFGIVLAKNGGALPRMALPFRFGIGGKIGPGSQWMSWVALKDVIGITMHALENGALSGPVNVVSPVPIRNADFSAALARAIHRPALFPAPAFVLRAALGEMAQALLLSSQRVLPEKLLSSGYSFEYTELMGSLRAIFQA
jgi:uncharacterized protein (TIGR01777 family)